MTLVTDADKKELEKRMNEYLPNAGLTFLIAMNADPIARELNGGRCLGIVPAGRRRAPGAKRDKV